jgi:hypothetical protein
MKTQKLLSLDNEIVSKLREEKNASSLVNKLLASHYKDSKLDNLSIEELKMLQTMIKSRDKLQSEIAELEKNLMSKKLELTEVMNHMGDIENGRCK